MKNKHFYTAVILLLFLAVGIQPARAQIVLSDSGWNKDVGDWDSGTKTGTLTQDVTETIQIISDEITLDGDGHTVDLANSTSSIGVDLSGRQYVTIQNINVKRCYTGITLSPSGYCNVINNTISYCTAKGIFMSAAGTCLIEGNTISNNGDTGILIQYGSIYNTLKNNTVSNNAGIGIFLSGEADIDYNEIYNNTVSNNITKGICLSQNANYNTIYNNNFIGNTTNADVIGVDNVFDLGDPAEGGKGGNYWCNWCPPDHPDTDPPDGIVDEPYIMPPYYNRGQDNFPWAVPDGWSTPTPPTAEEELVELIEKVEGYNGEFGINNALDAKLQNALDALTAKNAGQRQDAVNKMQSFINAVEAQNGDKIPVEVADELIADAQHIIDLILAE